MRSHGEWHIRRIRSWCGSCFESAATWCLMIIDELSSRRVPNLLGIVQDDFRMTLVADNVTVNLHLSSLKRLDAAEFILIRGKYDAGEGTGSIIFAEVEKTVT